MKKLVWFQVHEKGRCSKSEVGKLSVDQTGYFIVNCSFPVNKMLCFLVFEKSFGIFIGEIRSYVRPDGGRLVWLPEDNLVSNKANRICSTLEVMKLSPVFFWGGWGGREEQGLDFLGNSSGSQDEHRPNVGQLYGVPVDLMSSVLFGFQSMKVDMF